MAVSFKVQEYENWTWGDLTGNVIALREFFPSEIFSIVISFGSIKFFNSNWSVFLGFFFISFVLCTTTLCQVTICFHLVFVLFFQVIFISEYMSSGNLRQFLKKTKKNNKTFQLKVRKGKYQIPLSFWPLSIFKLIREIWQFSCQFMSYSCFQSKTLLWKGTNEADDYILILPGCSKPASF